MRWLLQGVALVSCTPDPCAEGMAYTADGASYATIREALNRAAQLDNVVHVCAGTHQLTTTILGDTPQDPGNPPTVRGEEGGGTVLVPQTWKDMVYAEDDAELVIDQITFTNSAVEGLRDLITMNDGGDEGDRVTPYDIEGEPEGALRVVGGVTFTNVTFTGNEGHWGGALSVWRDQPATITFSDCTFTSNEAINGTSGGAMLLYYDPLEADFWPEGGNTTIISDNTDWGQGDDDNGPDDIAFVSSDGDPYQPEVAVDASYRFDGVASFSCSGDTLACE